MKMRHLYLQQDSDIRQVRQQFTELYPYLRIDFFFSDNKREDKKKADVAYSEHVRLNEINPGFLGGVMEVFDNMSIFEFERKFFLQFGLLIQVSRRSGNLWLDTLNTNQWTLKEQNDHGEAISPGPANPQEPPFQNVPFGC